jgi:hypothetical protein
MRYFYTDPLAAAWMGKHFGMEFVDIKGHILQIRNNFDGFMAGDAFPRKAFIRPDSLHLLEPRLKDVITTGRGLPKQVRNVSLKRACPSYSTSLSSARKMIDKEAGNIIQRNGIAFHWPEVDKS